MCMMAPLVICSFSFFFKAVIEEVFMSICLSKLSSSKLACLIFSSICVFLISTINQFIKLTWKFVFCAIEVLIEICGDKCFYDTLAKVNMICILLI